MIKNLFRRAIFIALVAFGFGYLLAQDSYEFASSETQLLARYSEIIKENPYKRERKASQFFDELYTVVQHAGSFYYPFDTLKNIGKIYSPDQRLRIYTWNIPVGIDDNLYFGIIQYYANREKKYIALRLEDSPDQNQPISIKGWPGALYYQIIETKHAGKKYYTILGLNLSNRLSNKKVIDILSIDDFDRLDFCSKLFEYNGRLTDRIVFEYDEKANMTLRYNDSKQMIIFDHLSPQKPSLEGNYQFYGPDFTYDGLKFENGVWTHFTNIDVTN
jgi:hypothetical protein